MLKFYDVNKTIKPYVSCSQEKISLRDFSKEDITYRRLLIEEYRYCNAHEKEIIEKAEYIYKSVIQDKNPLMVKNCCDFAKLEAAVDLYLNPMQLPHFQPDLAQQRPQS